MYLQMTLADVLNMNKEPIGPGDYVFHEAKKGEFLLVVSEAFRTKTGKLGIKVRTLEGKVLPVYVENIQRP